MNASSHSEEESRLVARFVAQTRVAHLLSILQERSEMSSGAFQLYTLWDGVLRRDVLIGGGEEIGQIRAYAKPVFRAHRYFVSVEVVVFGASVEGEVTVVYTEYRAGAGEGGFVVSEQGPFVVEYGQGHEGRFVSNKGRMEGMN